MNVAMHPTALGGYINESQSRALRNADANEKQRWRGGPGTIHRTNYTSHLILDQSIDDDIQQRRRYLIPRDRSIGPNYRKFSSQQSYRYILFSNNSKERWSGN